MAFASSNTMQTTGVLRTTHSNNTAVNKDKQVPTVVLMPTSKMALQKEQSGTSPRQQGPCCCMPRQGGRVLYTYLYGHMRSGWLCTSTTLYQCCWMEGHD
eukprot:CCRYP_000146-RA/>CCRYP_000146-RA protein AED:0.54 eAED:0.42 QI:0/-1/0/1/-1/0/1/0/99